MLARTSHVFDLSTGSFTTDDRARLAPTSTPGLFRLNTTADIVSGASGKLSAHGFVSLTEGWANWEVHGKVCGLE